MTQDKLNLIYASWQNDDRSLFKKFLKNCKKVELLQFINFLVYGYPQMKNTDLFNCLISYLG